MSRGAESSIALWREKPAQMVRDLFEVEPDAWQQDVLEAFPHKQRIAMKAAKGPGKVLCCDMVFDTPTGRRRWGDIKPGDLVFAEDGSPTEVVEIFPNGVVPLYRITFDDGSSTLAGAEHLWKVKGATERRKGLDWTVVSTEQIVARGVRVKNGRWAGRQFEIPRHGQVQYPSTYLPLDPYLTGVWIGDGTKGLPAYSKPHREVEAEINRRGYLTSRSADDHVRILGSIGEFRALGPVFEAGSHGRFIPDHYKFAPIAAREALLRGLMDTDGCIGDDGHMEYDTTSERLAHDVVWLVRSLGGNALIKRAIKRGWYHDEEGVRVDCRDCYRVTVRTTFCPFYLPHKAARWKDPLRSKSTERYLTRYISSIEYERDGEAMCIQVAHPSRCYLANDFIVTHNTSLLAWIAWNFLLTRPEPKIAATSISGENLADNLWTEMAKWQKKSKLLSKKFEWTKTRIFAKESPETWWMSARRWSRTANAEDLGNTLAGLHADYILFLIDEAGGIPDAIMASAEAALSSPIEGHIVIAGNPTHLEGPLWRACTSSRALWHVVEITGDPDNPKRSPRISVEWARAQIAQYGRDNPWVLVNVFGQFPPGSLNALIGPDEVEAAMNRVWREFEYRLSPKVLGIDVAREGDDQSVICRRQGIVTFMPDAYRALNGPQGAGITARKILDYDIDATFIDNTGGFGATWIDSLRQLGQNPIAVGFSEKATQTRYVNKRAEMYFDAVKWIKDGGSLPMVPELKAALTQTTYSFKGDAMILEPKEIIKAKLGYSPDHADAFVLTFAQPVSSRTSRRSGGRHTRDWDPNEAYSEGGHT